MGQDNAGEVPPALVLRISLTLGNATPGVMDGTRGKGVLPPEPAIVEGVDLAWCHVRGGQT
jgi:hypothetical protein